MPFDGMQQAILPGPPKGRPPHRNRGPYWPGGRPGYDDWTERMKMMGCVGFLGSLAVTFALTEKAERFLADDGGAGVCSANRLLNVADVTAGIAALFLFVMMFGIPSMIFCKRPPALLIYHSLRIPTGLAFCVMSAWIAIDAVPAGNWSKVLASGLFAVFGAAVAWRSACYALPRLFDL